MTDPTPTAERALRDLLRLIDNVPWRDGTGLRLGPGVPQYDDAKEAVLTDPTPQPDPFPEDELEYLVDGVWVPVDELTQEQSEAWLNDVLNRGSCMIRGIHRRSRGDITSANGD